MYSYCEYHIYSSDVGVLKKLSLAGLNRLRYSWLRLGLASAGYRGLGVHDRPAVYSAGELTADSTEHDEIPGVSLLSLADKILWLKLPPLVKVLFLNYFVLHYTVHMYVLYYTLPPT